MYVTAEIDVDDVLIELDDDDLINELASRGIHVVSDGRSKEWTVECLTAIWLKRRVGNNDYQKELDELIYHALGKVI